MSLNHTSIRTLVVLVCVIAGCTRDDTSQDDRPAQSKDIESSSLAPYVECDESVADHVLLASVTVPNVLDGHQFRIPFCKAEREGATFGGGGDGSGGGGSSFSATGPDGGLNGFIGIESSTDKSVSVRVDLLWSSAQTKGEVKELIDIPIGKSGKKDLPEGRKIEWRFVAPGQENHD